MAVTTETRVMLQNYDGDAKFDAQGNYVSGGAYSLSITVDVDRSPQGTVRSETLRSVTIDNSRRQYATNYMVDIAGVRQIDSTTNPSFPPVAPGEVRTWPGLSFRIDNQSYSYSMG